MLSCSTVKADSADVFCTFINLIKNVIFLLLTSSTTEQLRYYAHLLAVTYEFVSKIFLKTLLTANRKEFSCDLFSGMACVPYNKHGKHFNLSR